MYATLRQFPLIVVLMMLASVLMIAPLLHAVWLEDWRTARTFFYHGTFFTFVAIMLGLVTANRPPRRNPLSQLLAILAAYVFLPLILAVPLDHLVPPITFGQAYFEMLSSLTTTGATVFSDPSTIPEPLHLWRATVAWMGGFMFLLAAVAILEPLQLGGFEMQAAISADAQRTLRRAGGGQSAMQDRLIQQARLIAPPYVALTGLLTLGLVMSGDRALVALCHAMSVLSTSGVSPIGGPQHGASGLIGEMLIFAFLFLAISHRSTTVLLRGDFRRAPLLDPEYKIAIVCVLGFTGLLFARHFLAAFDVDEQENLSAALRALWGSLFNIMSFLTTTGFDSADWATARNWSGLDTSGMILLALCLMGGGIATTTGGVKLLRIYALYKHGVREMQRLIHPHSVGGAGVTARRIRREGANLAWVFLMLFMIGIGAIMLMLTLLGQSFENALALSIAALTNTGPAAPLFDPKLTYATLDGVTRTVLSVAMIIGRLEVLVFVAILNPDYWRQ